MNRSFCLPGNIRIAVNGERREPVEARGTHIFASSEERVGEGVVMQVLAMNGVFDRYEVVGVRRGRGQFSECTQSAKSPMCSRTVHISCQADEAGYYPESCHIRKSIVVWRSEENKGYNLNRSTDHTKGSVLELNIQYFASRNEAEKESETILDIKAAFEEGSDMPLALKQCIPSASCVIVLLRIDGAGKFLHNLSPHTY